MNISQKGIDLIKSFEGCRLTAYKVTPSEKYWTIGYGHYGSDVYEGMKITQVQADTLFLKDIQRYIQAVNNFQFSFKLTQNQFDALVSFCYNLGTGILEDFRGMTAKQISNEIPLYVNSGGVKLQGLVNRRQREKELFDTGLVTQPQITTDEVIVKEKQETGIFYPNDKIYFRNYPLVHSSNPIIDSYSPSEKVIYDKVVVTNKYVYISWLSATSKQRRYMPIREVKNGIPQKMWGEIE